MNYKSKMNFCVSLFLVVILPLATFAQSNKRHRSSLQGNQAKSAMTKEDVLQMARLIMAIKRDYSIIDMDPEADFLVFVNEDRDTLEFFPKKTLPKRMEELGLLISKDGGQFAVHEPNTHYEGDATGTLKAITKPRAIFYSYKITAKGNEFLRNAPKTLGYALPRLKIASAKSAAEHSRVKPIKVVTYTPEEQQKTRDEFLRIARNKIEALFAPVTDNSALPNGLTCGPKLWTKLESQAIKNGVHQKPRRAISYVSTDGGPSTTTNITLPGTGISSREQVGLFLKTLIQAFPVDGRISIRELSETERSRYREIWEMFTETTPGFSPFIINAAFFVEYGSVRFLVKVLNDFETDIMNREPAISSIEIVENP